jgi:Zn-dependent protease with chaperone function
MGVHPKTAQRFRQTADSARQLDRILADRDCPQVFREGGSKIPAVGIYDSPEVNALATGVSKNSLLIAVTTGLLQQITRQEAEAVPGHEVAHAANGDRVTLALIGAAVNTSKMEAALHRYVDRLGWATVALALIGFPAHR